MAIDWGEIEDKYKSNFKEYAEAGNYTVKVDRCEFKTVSTGSIAQEFYFVDGDVKYPKATHWLSFKNDNWRAWHNRKLMELLGLSEDQAKKTIELCESKDGKEAITKAYEQSYKKLLAKHPSVEIAVFQDGQYKNADFTDNSVRMNRPKDNEEVVPDDIPEGEDISDELSDLPF